MGIEYITHCNSVRMRARGEGNLLCTLFSYDEVESFELAPMVLSPTTNRPVEELANFKQTEMKLRIEVDEIDEYFDISEILIFTKPVENSYPL